MNTSRECCYPVSNHVQAASPGMEVALNQNHMELPQLGCDRCQNQKRGRATPLSDLGTGCNLVGGLPYVGRGSNRFRFL